MLLRLGALRNPLWLAGNQPSGTIRQSLRSTSLLLWLAGNQPSGTIKPYKYLFYFQLWLAGNQPSGTIGGAEPSGNEGVPFLFGVQNSSNWAGGSSFAVRFLPM